MPSWKIARTKKQSKQVKLALIALGLVLGLVVLSQIFKFTEMLSSPWTKSKIENSYRLQGDFNVNLILKGKSISLLIFNPKDQKLTIVEIPDQTYLDVAGGLGKWQLSSIYGLGGDGLLQNSLANFFGLPIDGYLDPVSLSDLTDKNPFSLFLLLPKIKTDLSPLDLLKIKMGISLVRFDKINQINLEETGLLDKSSLADGTPILTADPVKLDALFSGLADPVIKAEHKTIAIFNSTNHPLLAQKAARILANIGADVIIVSNSSSQLDKTKITGEKSQTLDKLKQIFAVNGTIDPEDDLASSRAQINVYLGEDYFNKL